MEFNYQPVRLDRINTGNTQFRISTGAASAELVASIGQVGLINPPILKEEIDGYNIVSGFKRIEACRQLKMAEVFARILDAGLEMDRCIQIAIADNSSHRALNIIEQSRAVELLSGYHAGLGQLVSAAESAGLSINPDMAAKLRKLAVMNDLLKTGLLNGAIALPVALQLHDMDDPAFCGTLAQLLIELGLSLNRQREICEWIVAICRRDGMTAAQLLSINAIKSRLQNGDLDRRQKAQAIRNELKKIRYPNMVRFERRFSDIVEKLNLPKGTWLTAPQHFESPIYSLKLDFQCGQDLADKVTEIENLAQSKLLDTLWRDREIS
jgi:ParB family transcriptional regulator, chromosome partitioning protein